MSKSTWDYRVLRRVNNDDTSHTDYLHLAEVHYEDGVPWGWSSTAAAGNTMKELAGDLVLMVEALSRPVLDLNNDGTFRKGQR